MSRLDLRPAGAPVWTVGLLCRAVGEALDTRFNPVRVRGEISGFSRAASGHCYFSLKDTEGQVRCAMFRRAAMQLDFVPRDGEAVEVSGRLGVYEARGDLQLVVEQMQRAGQGALFEQFLRLKERLAAQGLFDEARKRALPSHPRGLAVVTSPQAAAWQDVVTALQRRVPHLPVWLSPAQVQGATAPASLIEALQRVYDRVQGPDALPIDLILLVRGGGSMEDLWAFNDEALAHQLARSPVPVISGVGHETDFTIADFVADLRAPTPTAAAELAATSREALLQQLQALQQGLQRGTERWLDRQAQGLDALAGRLGRPQQRLAAQRHSLQQWQHRLQSGLQAGLHQAWRRLDRQDERLRQSTTRDLLWPQQRLARQAERLAQARDRALQTPQQRLQHLSVRLAALDPQRVLERGFAWISDEQGQALTRSAQLRPGQTVQARLVDGQAQLQVQAVQADALAQAPRPD